VDAAGAAGAEAAAGAEEEEEEEVMVVADSEVVAAITQVVYPVIMATRDIMVEAWVVWGTMGMGECLQV
jgi:hypothetical protein